MLKLQVLPSLFSSLRDRLSSREVDYINFYSDHLPLIFINVVRARVFMDSITIIVPFTELNSTGRIV